MNITIIHQSHYQKPWNFEQPICGAQMLEMRHHSSLLSSFSGDFRCRSSTHTFEESIMRISSALERRRHPLLPSFKLLICFGFGEIPTRIELLCLFAVRENMMSSLPSDVLDYIVEKMTVVDAVKASVLAREWQFKWLSSSRFSLDSDVIAPMLIREDHRWDVIASVVYKYLRQHTNPVKIFSLKADCGNHHSEAYQWLQYLLDEELEELCIQNSELSSFRVPSHLFLLDKLKSLSLICCDLPVPSNFGGFNLLEKLLLENVFIYDDVLEQLIRSCPLLKNLSLLSIRGSEHFRIHAPRLTWLRVDTELMGIVIGASPHLSVFIMDATFRQPRRWIYIDYENVFQCLSGLGSLDKLSLSGDFIERLAFKHVRGRFPLKNDNVTSLQLKDIRFVHVEVFRVILLLLRACGNIKSFRFSFEVAMSGRSVASFFQEMGRKFLFPNLISMTVTCPSEAGMASAVNFIDYVIGNSRNLKNLTIEKDGVERINNYPVNKMLSRFRRSRPQASIVYKENGRVTNL